jgi:hypothetical protein
MASHSKSFHSSYDAQAQSFQVYNNGRWSVPNPFYLTADTSLTYQFFPHFHPYVTALIQRLNEGGVAELLASDTLYQPQPNPNNGQPLPLNVLPNSTRAILSVGANASRPDGTLVALPAGAPLTLADSTGVVIPSGATVVRPDGSTFKLAADTSVMLPGNLPMSTWSGILWTIAGTPTIVPDGTSATLPSGAALAVLTSDGSSVNLPNGTAIALASGLPQPFFYQGIFDASHYGPNPSVVQQPYPVKNIDFTFDGAYSIYNWELFFHAPLLIAIHLSQNQKFQDAQNWFHYVFNPTDNSPGPTPQRFWKVQPFQTTDVRMIEDILVNLSTGQDPELFQQTVSSIDAWKQNPFQPYAVAKYRPTAYMLKTVMAYLDNLIAWGDSLFQQYSVETINEATQLYVLAAQILGPKPQPVPVKGAVKPLSYNALRGNLDAFSNALADMQVDIPFDIAPLPNSGANLSGGQILPSIGQTLYFCIPRNGILLGYWDTVADRLFKIHNSLNLQGLFQAAPLYDPPIDPALLVRATAEGLDVNAIVSGLNQPLPLVRFQALVSKATEICQEVKSLGANLLAAIEKQDNETLALMRAQHENVIQGLAAAVKYSQWQDATKAQEGLEQSLQNAIQRYSYYQKLLGHSDAQIQSSIPQLAPLDTGGLQNQNFQPNDPPPMAFDPITVDVAPITPDVAQQFVSGSDGGLTTLSSSETQDLQKLSDARNSQQDAYWLEKTRADISDVPDIGNSVQIGPYGISTTIGGAYEARFFEGPARSKQRDAEAHTYEANMTSKLGSYSRREEEWLFQSNSAKGEINQTLKQLRGAQIRESIAQMEYNNQKKILTQQSQQIVDFLLGQDLGDEFQTKETTVGFYLWMKREVKALYAKSFQLAFEVAKKAERALQHELGDPSLSYIQYNYLDGTEGLLAGEKLLFDIKAMEMAYHDLNQREYELTKHVSLLQVAPLALVQLRATGSCMFTLPEELFDLDGPGHYFRRIKSLAVTAALVGGPYTSVNFTLTLLSSSIRTSPDPADGYQRKGSDDGRFNDYYGSIQSLVTSSAQSDSGLFESDSRDERLLPFERAGIVGSKWQLTLPADIRQFDFDTITDVILHVRYTAREGGEVLKQAALANLLKQIDNAQTVGSVRLISVRHTFPSQWAKFQSVTINATTPTAQLQLTLVPELYPFWAQGIIGSARLKAVEFFAEMSDPSVVPVGISDKPDKTGNNDVLALNPLLGNLLSGSLEKISPPAAVTDLSDPNRQPLTLYFDRNDMEDMWLALTWGKA